MPRPINFEFKTPKHKTLSINFSIAFFQFEKKEATVFSL
jgi:hypothetical protein